MTAVMTVALLVLEARKDASLHEALVQEPNQVAQRKQLPVQVAESAAYVLRELPKSEGGIWM